MHRMLGAIFFIANFFPGQLWVNYCCAVLILAGVNEDQKIVLVCYSAEALVQAVLIASL